MPDPGENIQSWSTTASSNANADASINWIEHMPRADVNNSARGMMAAHAKDRDLHNGSIVTTGTVNAQLFSSGYTPPFTTIPNGMTARLKVGAALTNTATMTLSMDGITAVTIKNGRGNELSSGEWRADSYVDILYDGTNWRLINGNFGGVSQVTAINTTVIDTSTGPVALVDFTNLDSSVYSRYSIIITDFVPENDGEALALTVSTDNGVTFPIDHTDYEAVEMYAGQGDGVASVANQADQSFLTLTWGMSHNTPQMTSQVVLDVFGFQTGKYPSFMWSNGWDDQIFYGGTMSRVSGFLINTTACNALRLWPTAGNILSGKFVLYGYV